MRGRLGPGEAGVARGVALNGRLRRLMPAYRVTLAYDGTGFQGWQRQAGAGTRTVQGTLEEALARLAGGERVAVAGAGRTDTGVHALGQVASFELAREMEGRSLAAALNGLLPGDVRVLDAGRAPEGFHARRSAVSKHYRYVLDTGAVQLPTRRHLAGHVPWRLDPSRVAAAAELFLGRRDFASLSSSGGSVKTTVRTVTRSAAAFVEPGLTLAPPAPAGAAEAAATTLVYDVEADGFLRRMVRSMVGGLVAAGRGACGVDDLRRALEARDRRAWPAPAEACGLTLVRVAYPPLPAAMLE